MTQLPKEHKVAPRWKRIDGDSKEDYELGDRAAINLDLRTYVVKVKNRSGLWNYAYAASLPAAKRKAKKMMEEEGT